MFGFLLTTKTIPITMLKALYISSISMSPNCLITSKIGRLSRIFFYSTEHPSGRIRGMFSVNPPPVM